MAMATPEEANKCTNLYWSDFGKADDKKRTFLSNLDPTQKQARKEWLQKMHLTPMPTGPYPFYMRDYGWWQVNLPSGPVQSCYCKRGDGNLDVNFVVENETTGAKQSVFDEKTKIKGVELFQESYDKETGKMLTKQIGPISLTSKLVTSLA